MEREENDFAGYLDREKTGWAMERKRPVITYGNGAVKAGQTVQMRDFFTAEDADGNAAAITILRAEDAAGRELDVWDGRICFGQQGKYRLWVRATDRHCAQTEKVFCIPVKK
jgi:hypothetical protein